MSRTTKWKAMLGACALTAMMTAALPAHAVQLSNDAQSAIPQQVQQLIDIDYRSMENSDTAMQMKARLMPPQLKALERALKASGLDESHDVDSLCFAAYRPAANSSFTRILGVAQGQFSVPDIIAAFNKKKVKPTMIRANKLYPMGAGGMMVTFLNPTTMLFGSLEALRPALAARDGRAPSIQSNTQMMAAMQQVQAQPIWSILDQKGTQFMMRSLLGQASQLADFNAVKTRLLSSSYTMNFNNGVKFALNVNTPDTITAATMSSLLNAAAMYEKLSGTPVEKQAIDATSIDSTAGVLEVRFNTTDDEFASLLQSPLFQTVVK
ncbi:MULTISPECIES: hypothetical protein [Acidobacterium]|uniref:hypothetical protein n=1 Tax=Acidobacterium TaxID=33973 RepID=UPI0002FF285C|nr:MULTISPECIES: hypothetical protein [Acidobacterium]